MGIDYYNIKRWTRMLLGKSIYHVPQNIGTEFEPGVIKGYFNDLTQKVLQGEKNLDNGIPVLEHSNGAFIKMPTMIIQYGLGAYDLWIRHKEPQYLEKAKKCADWLLKNQNDNGAWSTFFYIYPDHPFSAMPQGEGASLLIRLYLETKDDSYFQSAEKAVDFMLRDVKDGGVADYSDGLVLMEFTHLPLVMNGWIFALFGLYDYNLLTGKKSVELEKTLESLKKQLPVFDCKYWSNYDVNGKIASPFYHNLHVAQMEALFQVTKDDRFKEMGAKWKAEQSHLLNRTLAFTKKAYQKVME